MSVNVIRSVQGNLFLRSSVSLGRRPPPRSWRHSSPPDGQCQQPRPHKSPWAVAAACGPRSAVTCTKRTGAWLPDFEGEEPRFCVNPWLCSQFQKVFLEIPAIWEKAEAESPLRRYSATATARASAVLRTRPRASRFKIVSWLSITWDIPAAPRAPLQARSHCRYSDVYRALGREW